MSSFLLGAFLVGFILTVLSVALGALDIGGADLPGAPGDPAAISPVNLQSIVAFVMCFGGTGYLLERAGWALWLVLPLASVGGLGGGWLIYRFLRLMFRGETNIPIGSDGLVGTVGYLSLPLRAGGTGELIYTTGGIRQVSAARAVDGASMARGQTVVVRRYERGIAYVEPIDATRVKEE